MSSSFKGIRRIEELLSAAEAAVEFIKKKFPKDSADLGKEEGVMRLRLWQAICRIHNGD